MHSRRRYRRYGSRNNILTKEAKKSQHIEKNLFTKIGECAKIGYDDSNIRRYAMKCPFCNNPDSKVIDSRPVSDGASIRRRRECLVCQKRFTTFEVLESVQIFVTKKNGETELFDRTKLLAGVLKATQKRPVSAEEIVGEIENELQNSLKKEVSTAEIGEMVMEKLKVRDQVAYVRFASVYREFTDVENFLTELMELKDAKNGGS